MPQPLNDRVLEKVRGFITQNLLYARPDAEIAPHERLLERGIIDSMGVIELIQFLEAEFGVEISDEEITEQNLGSLAAISDFVGTKRGH